MGLSLQVRLPPTGFGAVQLINDEKNRRAQNSSQLVTTQVGSVEGFPGSARKGVQKQRASSLKNKTK